MKDYVAMIKKSGSSTPHKVYITAKDTEEALSKMCQASNVVSPSVLAEFELLQIIDAGDGYLPVAGSPAKRGRTLPVTFPPKAPMALVPVERHMGPVEVTPVVVKPVELVRPVEEYADTGYLTAEAL